MLMMGYRRVPQPKYGVIDEENAIRASQQLRTAAMP